MALAKVTPGCVVFARGCGVGVGGDDRCLHEGFEPGPGHPPVRGGRDPRVHLGCFLHGEVAGLAGDVAGVALGDLEGLHPRPQLWQPVLQVEDVGDQPSAGVGGEAHPGSQHRGGELGDQRGALTTEADRAFASRELGPDGIDGAGVVLTGELGNQPQERGAGLQLGLSEHIDLVEDRALTQVQRRRRCCGHG